MIHYIISSIDYKNIQKNINPFIEKNKSNSAIYFDLRKEIPSIFIKYNNLLESVRNKLDENDVVVFLHDDIEIRDQYFEKKLELYFKYKTNVGIAGVIGTTEFTDSCGWWLTDRMINTRGRIIQGMNDGSEHIMAENGGMDEHGIVSVDGCILFMPSKIAKTFKFDESTYSGFHFYDVDTCFTLLEKGYDIGIIDVLVKHQSEGPLTKSWYDNREKFLNKWKHLKFPVTKSSFK
jgi:hypothetical protein